MRLLKVAPSSGENHLYAAYQDDSGSCFIYRAHEAENTLHIPSSVFEKGLTNCNVELVQSKSCSKKCPASGQSLAKNVTKNSTLGAKQVIKDGKLDLDALSRAGQLMDRGGLTKAGRGLQKHGYRQGSAFPLPNGSPFKINQQAQNIVDNILTHPNSPVHYRTHRQFGKIIDVKVPDVGGVRFSHSGEMIELLEP
jgi:hypothetical protein